MTGPVVSLSLSPPADLSRLGFPAREFDRLAFELATRLVRARVRVLYGGHLQPGSLTVAIFDYVAGAYGSRLLDPESTGQRPFLHLLPLTEFATTSYQRLVEVLEAFGRFAETHVALSADTTARLRVSYADDSTQYGARLSLKPSPRGEVIIIENQDHLRRIGEGVDQRDALTWMRAASGRIESGRIVAGGKRGDLGVPADLDKYSGKMPGIVEEILHSRAAGHPTLVLGGYGGAARDAAISLGLLGLKARVPFLGERQNGAKEAEAALAQIAGQSESTDIDALRNFAMRMDTETLARQAVAWMVERLGQRADGQDT